MKQTLIFIGGEDVSARIEISKKFIDIGYDVEIMGTEASDKFEKNSITYKKYSLNRELNILSDIKTILKLRKILKEKKETVIAHAFDTKPTIFLPIASIGLANVKVARTITGMGRIFTEDNFKNRVLKSVYNIVQKIISKRVNFTIFQNSDDYNYFIDNKLIGSNNATVIKSSGIDLKKFTNSVDTIKIEKIKNELELDSKEKTIILVSRMVKQKGILDYLEAAKLCYENSYRYNFLLVGQLDSDNSITIDEINRYSKYVKYLGRREDVKELLTLSDLFVLPTYYREGVPRVLLEASSRGLALIATDMPGCRDVVIDQYNGKLINIKDSRDLYDKIIFIINNGKLDEFGKNATEKVKEFDLDMVVIKYDEVYKRLGANYDANTIS